MGWFSDMMETCIIQKEDGRVGLHLNPLIRMCAEEPDEAKDTLRLLSKLVQESNKYEETLESFVLGSLFFGYKLAAEDSESSPPVSDLAQEFPVAAKCFEALKENGWFQTI